VPADEHGSKQPTTTDATDAILAAAIPTTTAKFGKA